jgi:hypothetical protein
MPGFPDIAGRTVITPASSTHDSRTMSAFVIFEKFREDPHLGRVGEVAADLDEAGTELAVVHVEVVRVDPPLLLESRSTHSTSKLTCPASTPLMFTTLAMAPACTARAGLSGPDLTNLILHWWAAGRGPPPTNVHLSSAPRPGSGEDFDTLSSQLRSTSYCCRTGQLTSGVNS